MPLDVQGIRLTDDHSLESASEVMSQLHFHQRIPNGRQACMDLLRSLGFQRNQDGGDHTQFVFQGQCLILGDAGVGKTSLKKSLMGRPFNTQEPVTNGVEVDLVDGKWNELDADKDLTFGSFANFRQSVLYEGTLYGPGGVEFTFNQEITSSMSATTTFLFMLYGICWILSMVSLLAYTRVPPSFCAFSFCTFLVAVLSYFLPSEHPQSLKIFMVFYVTLPPFITGLAIQFLLRGLVTGIDCGYTEFSSSEATTFSGYHFIWVVHLLIITTLFMKVVVDVYFLSAKEHFKKYVTSWYTSDESFLPGQAKFDSVPIFPLIALFLFFIVTGIVYGCLIQLSTVVSTLQSCQTLHSIAICLFGSVILRHEQTLFMLVSWQTLLLILYMFWAKLDLTLNSFHSQTTYLGIIAVWVCQNLYDWIDDNVIFNCRRGNHTPFTFVLIEKVMLNYEQLKRALHSKFSGFKLKLLDFSGNKAYRAYNHIFMRQGAMYIVVFNMANFADDNFANLESKLRRICYWLESICSKAGSKTPIFLVGTHRGHMDKTCLKSINMHLQEHLWHLFSDELVVNKEENLLYFPTEGSSGRKDTGIRNLQKEIMSTAEEHKSTMAKEIPYSWIKIQDAIISLRQKRLKKAKFCVRLEQFPIAVGNFICSNWSQDTLRYFHEKGLVIYIDQCQDSELSNWILLKPDILVDIITKLLTPLTSEEEILQQGFRRDWELLHAKGMLTDNLLGKILSTFEEDANALQSFMEEYDIICPLFCNATNRSEEARVTHFVPSLLPEVANSDPTVWHDEPDDKKFFVFFHNFLPQPLFQKLLSRAYKSSRLGFCEGQPFIGRNVGRFWLWPSRPYRLLLLKNQDMIEVTFNFSGTGKESSDVLCQVFSMVDGICKRYFPFVKFHCGPACPSDKCPGHQGDYISHPGIQTSRAQRCHVFNVLPARQEGTVASFYCVNKDFSEQLKEWHSF